MRGDPGMAIQQPTSDADIWIERAVHQNAVGGVDGALKKGMDDFGVRYKKRFNDDVKLYAPYVYDAVMVMADAMQRAKSSEPAKYLPELAKTTGYKGVTGTISFDEKGDVKNGALTLYTFKAGKRDALAVVR